MASEMVQLILQAKDLASEAVGRLRSGMEKLTETTQSYQSTVERLSGPVNQFKSTIATLAGAVGVAGLAKSFIDINASAEKTRLMLEGLTGSAEKADEAFQWILDFSTKAPFSIDALKDSFVKLQTAGLDPMSGSLQTLTDAIAAFGGSDEDLKLVSIAIQQMAGKGVVSMEELRQQLGERIPTAMQAMAQGLGMSMSQLSQAIEKGAISAKQGLSAMMSELDKMYAGRGQQMMTSWAGLISNVRVAWEKFMLTLGETGVFERLKGIIDGVLRKIEEMKESGDLKVWADRIASLVSSMITLFTTLAGVLARVIDVFGPFLPAIAQVIVYFTTLKVVLGGLIEIPVRLVANILALSDTFKTLIRGEVLTFFEKLKYMIYMNVTAATALGTAMQAAMALGAAAVGYLIGQVIILIAEHIKLKKINESIEENAKALKERYDTLNVALSAVNDRIKEATEAYKQGKMTSEEYSQTIHQLNIENAALSKASVDSVTAMTNFMSAIRNTDTEMKNARKSFEEGKISAEDYYNTIDRLKQKKEALFEKARMLRDGLKDIDTQMMRLKESFDAGAISEAEFSRRTEELNARKRQLIISLEKTATATAQAQKTYDDFISSLQEGSADYIAVEEKRIKTVEANLEYEKALLKKSYTENTISREEYFARLQELDQQAFDAHKKLIEDKIAFETSKEEQDFLKIAELQEQKKQLLLKFETEKIKVIEDAAKEAEKVREDEYKHFESIQEQYLKALQSGMELQNTIEETMVKQGLMRESELLENQLARYKEIAQEEIRIVEEKMQRLEELGQSESNEYANLASERIRLQNEMQAKIIQSEQAISEQRVKEEQEALEFIAKILNDKEKLIEIEYQKQLDMLEKYHAQGLISEENYQKALTALEEQFAQERMSNFERELKETTEALTAYTDMIADRRRRLYESVKGLVTENFEDVKKYFKDATAALKITVDDVSNEINTFMKSTTWAAYDTFWNASLFGRRLVDMIGTSIYEWSSRVAEYIQYVKGLMASLMDYIDSLRMQLAQLRGDRLAELDIWYEQEKKKLAEKYETELGMTQQYYEALALLQELYNEKKKKLLEEEAALSKPYNETEKTSTTGAASSLSPIINYLNDFQNELSQSIATAIGKLPEPKVEVKQDLRLESIFEVKTYDPEMTDRYIKDIFFPRFERYLKLKGINL